MADTATAPSTSVVVEDLGPVRKRVRISVPAESVASRLKDRYEELRRNATLPGFRRGKVPAELLERRFGDSLREETRTQIIGESFQEAVRTHDLRVVGEPELDPATRAARLEPGAGLDFSVEIEVVPSFEKPSIDGLEIKRPVVEVNDEHVDAELKRTCFRLGRPEPIDGPFEHHDRAAARALLRKEGVAEPIFQADRGLVIVPGPEDGGRGTLFGLLVEGLAEKLLGKRVGDTVVVETVGPPAHEREDIRNAKLAFELTFLQAERVHPRSPDELVADYGFQNHEELLSQIRLGLEQRRDLEQRAAMREQLYEYLLSKVDFEVPASLTEQQLVRMLERQRVELLYRGLDPEQIETQLATMRASTEAQTRIRLRLYFILAAFAEELGVGVSEGEVNARIAMMARQRGMRPEKLRAELSQTGQLSEMALQIREHKVADTLLERCAVSEMPADEWNRMVTSRRPGA